MTVSPELKAAAYAQETSDGLLVLLTLDHADLAEPIRVVANTVNVTSRGQEFIAFPFEVVLPGSSEDAPPRARLTIDNVSREITAAIRSIGSAVDVTIEAVRLEDPDSVEVSFPDFKLRDVTWDVNTVSGELQLEDMTREPFPADNFSPAEFPGLLR